jgi:UPF0716 family protein affecting phage T7 exclusion
VGNFLLTHNHLLERLALFAAAVLLIKPGWITDLTGLLIIVAVLFSQHWRLRRLKNHSART